MLKRTPMKTAAEATGASQPTRKSQKKKPGAGKAGRAQRPLPNLAPEVTQLIEKHGGNRTKAAAAMGYTSPGVFIQLNDGTTAYSEKMKERVERALRDEPPLPMRSNRWGGGKHSHLDAGNLGLAIVVVAKDDLEDIMDAAGPMRGKIVLRMNLIGDVTLCVYEFANKTMMHLFREFALEKGAEARTP